MLIVTIVQNFVKLPYLEVTFLETSYFSVWDFADPKFTDKMTYFNFFADSASPHGDWYLVKI